MKKKKFIGETLYHGDVKVRFYDDGTHDDIIQVPIIQESTNLSNKENGGILAGCIFLGIVIGVLIMGGIWVMNEANSLDYRNKMSLSGDMKKISDYKDCLNNLSNMTTNWNDKAYGVQFYIVHAPDCDVYLKSNKI